eukprot:TRINITY_DN32248_c1_g1_i1.p1 TRINITY_DN32248_c1_g1~~TRINITY_DN32248_c1_g1_i1.p1  ORF type:complete len:185 (+),score=79.59 TRINITY_DN32248_c1_g1_i1:44-556(+)
MAEAANHHDPSESSIEMPKGVTLLRMDAKRIEMIKLLNEATFPVMYQPVFYDNLYSQGRDWSWLAHYYTETLVGAICCRLEAEGRVYIMTLGVLEPYRRMGIASALLRTAMAEARKSPEVKSLSLHVQTTHQVAIDFYKSFGFEIKETVKDYYKNLGADAYLLSLDVSSQ